MATRQLDICCLAALSGAVLFLSGYVFGYSNDVEDFSSTALTTHLFINAVVQSQNPLWTELLGIGLPQPFRISLIQHPLGFLFALLRPLDAIKIIVLIQGLSATLVFYILGRRLGMSGLIAATCGLAYILSSSSLQYLFIDDHFSAFLSWCFYPLIVYLFIRLSESVDTRQTAALGAGLGLAMGLMIATSLASHILSYLIVMTVFFISPVGIAARLWRPLALGAAISILICSGLLYILISELIQFHQNAVRATHENPGLLRHVTSALSLPYWQELWISAESFSRVVQQNNHRAAGFGAVAAATIPIALLSPLGPLGLKVKISFVAAVIFALLPPSAYLKIITATWVFRDGINFFGILLFGLLLSRISRARSDKSQWIVSIACVTQLCVLLAAAAPAWYRVFQNGLNPDLRPSNLSKLENDSVFFGKLKRIIGTAGGRVLMSGEFADNAKRRTESIQYGFVVNTGAFHGVQVVNAWPRGIATSSLYPDLALMEGRINATPTNIQDKFFLDVLGIRYVAALSNEKVSPELENAGTITLNQQINLTIWRNPDAWPSVVELGLNSRQTTLLTKPGCEHSRFLCSDFSPVQPLLKDRPATEVKLAAGSISFNLKAAEHDRIFMVNSWYRPGWKADDSRIGVFPLFGSLIGVSVPAGVTDVTLGYRPAGLIFCYALSTLTILLAGIFIAFFYWSSRGAHPLSSRSSIASD